MARLQILELPEGASDDRAPFVLIVDQMPADDATFDQLRTDLSEDVAARIGARAVLAFEGSIEIPANDTSAYLAADQPETRVMLGDREVANVVAPDALRMRVANQDRDLDAREALIDTHRVEADARVAKFVDDSWRIQQERETALLDALGMDRTRSWDDILLSARALRAVHEAEEASIQRVRDLPMRPEMMNAQQEHPSVWMHGYECGVLAARSALRPRNEPTAKPTDA